MTKTDIQITDGYSGRPEDVYMRLSRDGHLLFFAPNAVSPRTFYPSSRDARKVLGSRLRCPYTGERLRPVRDGDAVMFLGGFDPRRPLSRQEFLHFAAMRGGKSPVSLSEHRVEPVSDSLPMALSHEVPVSQEALDSVEELVDHVRKDVP